MVLGYLGSISYVGMWKHGKASSNMERQKHGATVCIVLDISTDVLIYITWKKPGNANGNMERQTHGAGRDSEGFSHNDSRRVTTRLNGIVGYCGG